MPLEAAFSLSLKIVEVWQPPERFELKINSPNLAEEQKDN